MIADLKPYSETKPTTQAWLGRVPRHWPVVPNRALFAEVKERNHPDEEMLSVTITRGIVPQRALLAESSKKDSSNLDRSAYKLVRPRDIAYNKMRAWQGAIGASTLRGIISPAYVVMRLRKADSWPKYFHHLFRTPQFAKEAERWSYGITSDMWSLRPEHFRLIYTPEPPPVEQAGIVRFLDWANERLERAIRSKRKVIALLNEQKQAIIHRAVTRGLDPSVPLKPSGIPGLGDIPQHWEVRQLRHMGRLHKGVGGSKEDAIPEGVPCVRYGELYFHFRNFIRHPRGFVSSERAAAYTPIRAGDVLFAASGEKTEEIGKSAVNLYAGQAVCGGDVVIFRPSVAVHAAFLGYALDSYGAAHQKATMCRGTTIKHIYPDELRGLWTCFPPVPEQAEIAAALDSELLGCNSAISRLEREIELLREYRTRLVADVVTGQLDVREAAARLPEETVQHAGEEDADLSDETEPSDEEVGV
jgi:type I restriction enzyme, S subunit